MLKLLWTQERLLCGWSVWVSAYCPLMDEKELYWLAGLLEGEGSFMRGAPSRPNTPMVSLSMTDEDVVARVGRMLGVSYYPDKTKRKNPA